MAIDRSLFIKKRPRKTKVLSCADLGGDVIISVLSAAEKEEFEGWVTSVKENMAPGFLRGHIRAKLVCLSVLDDSGARMFDDKNADDLTAVGSQPADTIMYLFDEILSLNAFTKKDGEALLKNSEPTPVDGSISSLPNA